MAAAQVRKQEFAKLEEEHRIAEEKRKAEVERIRKIKEEEER